MEGFIDKLRVRVLKHCITHKLSVRQFLLQLDENGLHNWNSLNRKANDKKGQIGLLLKLIKFFNYDN